MVAFLKDILLYRLILAYMRVPACYDASITEVADVNSHHDNNNVNGVSGFRHHEQAFWYLNINAMFHLSDLVDYFCI